MIIGYVLTSSDAEVNATQVQALQAAGATQIFTDDIAKRRRLRSGFERMVLALRSGDTVMTPDLPHFSQSLKDLVEGLLAIGLRGAQLQCLADETGLCAELLSTGGLDLLSALIQFERRRISAQTREGLVRAKKMGRRAGRPFTLSASQQEAVQQLRDIEHWPVEQIAAKFGVSTRTIYRIRRGCVLV